MERVTAEDLTKAMKLLGLSFTEDRLQILTPFLNATLETLRPLSKLALPKEFETTSYMARLRERGRAKGSENI